MAKQKKEIRVTSKWYDLVGGPRDGDEMKLVFPPVEYLRLAFPEWCTYKWDGSVFVYVGEEKPPVKEGALW